MSREGRSVALVKWALLAQSTGTKVDIVSSNQDLAIQAAEYADKFYNSDILGKQQDYSDGKAHEAWARWGKNKTNHKIGENGKIHVMRTFGEWDMSDPSGHVREYYYDKLKSEFMMERHTADELSQMQTRIIETRALELMEADIQREIRSIRKRRGIIDEAPPSAAQPSGPGCIRVGDQQLCLAPPPVPIEPPQGSQPPALQPGTAGRARRRPNSVFLRFPTIEEPGPGRVHPRREYPARQRYHRRPADLLLKRGG
ncbi:MAG: hypothetical protein Q8T11_11320 [Elusimicrobiota bacterium]|nr:hypothetical protein [Elusimicrobiota bacterium]